MRAFVSKCDPMWPHVTPYGAFVSLCVHIWSCVPTCWFIWVHVNQNWPIRSFIWVHLHSTEYRWTNVGPSAQLGQCGLVCVHRLTYVYMVPCGHMWVYVSTCESMWGHVTPWKHLLAMWAFVPIWWAFVPIWWAHVQVVYMCVHALCGPMWASVQNMWTHVSPWWHMWVAKTKFSLIKTF